jgi:hypothetical protein
VQDKDGNIFIDQPFELFDHVINHLRALQVATPLGPPVAPPFNDDAGRCKDNGREIDKNKRCDYIRLVEYYGLTSALYPLEFTVLDGDRTKVDLVSRAGVYSMDARERVTVTLSPGNCTHGRHATAFEVTLGPFSHARVGWKSQSADSVMFDCVEKKTIGYYQSETPAENMSGVTVEESTVLRIEATEFFKWFVNGQLVASCNEEASYFRFRLACIELMGKCSISVELDY